MESWLHDVILSSGFWAYFIVFLLFFLETGCILTPFFPGDSLLFALGSYCAMPECLLEIGTLFLLLWLASFLGNQVNYYLGKQFGKPLLLTCRVNPKYLEKTRAFYEKHGSFTVFLARFLPIIRTFVPFFAGVSHMFPKRFFWFNLMGGMSWVGLFLGLGYFFGTLPVVKEHFPLAMLFIVFVSLLPSLYSFFKQK